MVNVPVDDLKIVKGLDTLRLYQFNTEVAKHYFCSRCGIYTHHQRRADPSCFGVNLGCLEGVDPYQLDTSVVTLVDGVNHISDRETV